MFETRCYYFEPVLPNFYPHIDAGIFSFFHFFYQLSLRGIPIILANFYPDAGHGFAGPLRTQLPKGLPVTRL